MASLHVWWGADDEALVVSVFYTDLSGLGSRANRSHLDRSRAADSLSALPAAFSVEEAGDS